MFFLPLCFLQGTEGHFGSFPEDIFHILPKLGRTFQIKCSSHLFTSSHALCVGDGLQLGRPELPQLLLVLPQVCLAADENHGGPSAEMSDFREPLDEDVIVAGGVHDIVADENEVRVLVGQRPQPIVVFLPSRVVEVQGHFLVAHCHTSRVLLKHRWGIVLGKGALAVHHEQRRLAAAAVTHDHYLQLLPCRAGGGGRGRSTWGVHSPEPAALDAALWPEPS